jgi:hypothetical protein
MPAARLCSHIRENGFLCNSPALRDRDYCYFHLNIRGRGLNSARARRSREKLPLNLPFPEDMHAVQVSLHEVMLAVANRRIDLKEANTLLHGLHQASINIGNRRFGKLEHITLPDDRLIASYPDFELDHNLPEGIDVSLPPAEAWQDVEPEPQPQPELTPAPSRKPVRPARPASGNTKNHVA